MVTVCEYFTAYGLEPKPESVVVLCSFFNTGTTPVLSSFFVGLITKRAHVFLTNTLQYFYLPKSRSAAMTNICLSRGELN